MDRIIAQYLQTHRRLVVPQLGAFIRRQQGDEVVFSELMRRDDGVLRGLLVAQRGMSDLEAAGAVDRFVFEVRLALQQGRRYPIPGLGSFASAGEGRLAFRYEPVPASEEEGERIAPPAVGGPKAEREQQAVRRGDAGSAVPGKPEQDGAPHVSVSPKCSPEPCVKGLRYGKPLRTTDAYTYVNGRPPRRFDKFMMLAVAAALVALAAILYGYLRERRVEQQELQYIEQLVPDAETAGAADAADPAQE